MNLAIKSLKVCLINLMKKKAEFIAYYKQLKLASLPNERLLFMDAVLEE